VNTKLLLCAERLTRERVA